MIHSKRDYINKIYKTKKIYLFGMTIPGAVNPSPFNITDLQVPMRINTHVTYPRQAVLAKNQLVLFKCQLSI